MYHARRLSLTEFDMAKGGQTVAAITFPTKLWSAKGAPLDGKLAAAGWSDVPQVIVNGEKLRAQRRLLTDRALANDYEVWFEDESGPRITATVTFKPRKALIVYRGQNYDLPLKSLFRFRYTLSRDGRDILTLKETTPFLTFTSRRSFALSPHGECDDMLATFALFLSVCAFLGS